MEWGRSCSTVPRFGRCPCCSPNGVIYVLDAGGTRVQKVEGSRLMPMVDSEELPEEHAFRRIHTFLYRIRKVLYISDCENDRILRFAEGTSVPTVVADFGDRDGVNLEWALCD